MNIKILIFTSNLVILLQTIFAQFLPQNSIRSQPSVLPFGSFNNLPTGNNLPATNTLTTLNSLLGENELPANRLQLLNGVPISNGLASNGFNNNAYLNNNLPVFPVNNFLTNNLAGNFPNLNNLQSNSLPGGSNNNLPINSFLTILPGVDNLPNLNSLPSANSQNINPIQNYNLPNNDFVSNELFLASNGIITPGNGVQNINNFAQNINNLANIAPDLIQNLSTNQFIANNILPSIDNKPLGNIIDNNRALLSAKHAIPINNEAQLNVLTANNLGNNLPFRNELSSQVINLNNVMTQIPLCEDLSIPNLPSENIVFSNLANNINSISAVPNTITNNLQQPNGLQYTNMQDINNKINQNNILNNIESFLTPLAINVPNYNSDNIQNLQTNARRSISGLPLANLVNNYLPNNMVTCGMPSENLPIVNLLARKLAEYNVPNYNLPELPVNQIVADLPVLKKINVPNINPNNNMFSLGHLTNLPLLNGLPVIGVTETVTVINTAPSLYL